MKLLQYMKWGVKVSMDKTSLYLQRFSCFKIFKNQNEFQ